MPGLAVLEKELRQSAGGTSRRLLQNGTGRGVHNGDLFAQSQVLKESQENSGVSSVNGSVLENVRQSKQRFIFISPLFLGCILMRQKSFLCAAYQRWTTEM